GLTPPEAIGLLLTRPEERAQLVGGRRLLVRALFRPRQQQPDRLGRGESVARRGRGKSGRCREAQLPDGPRDRAVRAGIAQPLNLAAERPCVAAALSPALAEVRLIG